jgi:phosphate:Na+ symporter
VLKCTLVGIVVTGIIQSSAAAAAISLTLAYNCVISFETASALVFGMNIGTTVTAWLAALNASTEARRAALAHTLFNCIGVLLLAPLFLPVFVPAMHRLYPSMNEVVNGVMPHVTAPIAFFHTVFNVVTTLFFLPFLAPFAALVRRLIPGKEFTERPRLTMLEPKKMSPGIAVEQAKQEVVQMATTARQMLADFRLILTGQGKPELEAGIFEAEAALDVTQHEVSDFLGKVMSAHLPTDVAYRARMLLRVADEYESVSDEIQALLKMMLRMRKNEMALSAEGLSEMLSLHDRCTLFAENVTTAFVKGQASFALDSFSSALHIEAQAITTCIKEVRAAQLQRLTNHGPHADPIKVVLLMDLLSVYRRLKEDCLNIGEAIIDERVDAT